MSYSLEMRLEALADIDEAAEWYEKNEVGLGVDFARTVVEAIDSLLVNPLVNRLRDRRRNIRWLLINRFPYKVVYQTQHERVTVFAVLHAARHERYWKERM